MVDRKVASRSVKKGITECTFVESSSMGTVTSQLDDLFSEATCFALFMLLDSLPYNSVTAAASDSLRRSAASFLALSCLSFAS